MSRPSSPRPPSPLKRRLMLAFFSWYPPYAGAGIRVVTKQPERGLYEAEMRLRSWNRNYLGTHFGGSLYSMCDPFYLLILSDQLGPDYVVWDKAASIRFRRPGRGRVRARFEVSPAAVAEIRRRVEAEGKVEPTFSTQVLDDAGQVIAEVEKVLHVRRRDTAP